MLNPRLIAFYLPQFHPISENDLWWGKGFTEWTNVAKAKPVFRGHYQPQLPADLGFYDLRVPEVRQGQADLAREHGIYGFCYYHYWFNGRRLLQRPFEEVLATGKPDFPFCLCWANENWTRAWDGRDRQVLLTQNYHEADDRAHLQSLVQAFKDPRYLRVDNKPIFLVYRAHQLPDPIRTTGVWREEAARLGLGELFLCRVESNFADERDDPGSLGFDAAVEFQPDSVELLRHLEMGHDLSQTQGWRRMSRRVKKGLWRRAQRLAARMGWENANHLVYDLRRLPELKLAKPEPDYLRFPGVAPAWDNSPRRRAGGAFILNHSTPDVYEEWLRTVLRRLASRPREHQLLFVNAWNEWAEGCHLEPCQRWAHGYLEATRRAVRESESNTPISRSGAVT